LSLTIQTTKLDCLSLPSLFSLILYLQLRLEPIKTNHPKMPQAPGLTHKQLTRLKKFARDKHYSSPLWGISDEEREVYNLTSEAHF